MIRPFLLPIMVICLGVLLLLVGEVHGRAVARSQGAAQRAADAAAVAKREAENAQALSHALDINRVIEAQYAQAQAASVDANRKLADSLRRYAALSAHPVPSTPQGSGEPPHPAAESPGAGQFAALVGQLSEACRDDALALSALQQWVRESGLE